MDLTNVFYITGAALFGLGGGAFIGFVLVKIIEYGLYQFGILGGVVEFLVYRKKFKKWIKDNPDKLAH